MCNRLDIIFLGGYNDRVEEEMITVQEAALRKGVRATAIYNAIERGALVTTEVFGRKVLRAADVDAYQPGSYGGVKRAKLPRGPGRRPKSG